jgi:hypothetical protein
MLTKETVCDVESEHAEIALQLFFPGTIVKLCARKHNGDHEEIFIIGRSNKLSMTKNRIRNNISESVGTKHQIEMAHYFLRKNLTVTKLQYNKHTICGQITTI